MLLAFELSQQTKVGKYIPVKVGFGLDSSIITLLDLTPTVPDVPAGRDRFP